MKATTITTQTKVDIAIQAINNPEVKAKELAELFNVSESTVKRAKKDYAEEALKQLEAAKQAEVEAAQVQDKPKSEAKPSAKAQDFPTGARGFKGRNGRWEVLNAMFAELGFDLPAKQLWEEANKRGVAAGLKPLNRGSFYSMLSIAKKSQTV